MLFKNRVGIKSVASILVETLKELGVNSIFGYPGASVLSIYKKKKKTNEITHYLVRHEQAAVHAAEGYARVSGKPGVVLVTSGPGFTNTITGIANAYADSTPLIILAGDVSNNNSGKNKIFQAVNIESMVSSCTKKTYVLTKHDNIHKILTEAYYTANSGVKGPVVIVLPRNVLEMNYTGFTDIYMNNAEKEKTYEKEISKLNDIIKQAEKPLILVGGGAINASGEVIKFAEKFKIPVISTLMGIGVFPSENDLYMGMIGLNGTHSANKILTKCDLLIALGAAFSDRSTCKKTEFANNAKIVSINLSHISEEFDYEIIADVKIFLKQFLKKSNILENSNWLNIAANIKNEFSVQNSSQSCLHSSYVLATLSKYTEKFKPVVVTDVGQHQMLTAQFFHFNSPQKFITSGGLGTMGFGLPAAMGAYISNPDSLVLNITGDGSFQMNLQELATCREHKIPVKIIIMNNGYLGMVRQIQEKIYNNRYQVKMKNPDFVKIAEAYDLFAIRVTNKDELVPAISKAIEHNGTVILDIMIDSFEEI